MINKEFQELKREWAVNIDERNVVMEKIRENLIARNGGLSNYKFEYTSNKTIDVNTIDNPEDFFAIDGDMCSRGF